MTNPLKGEIDLVLGTKTYKARLTVDAIINIEESVGCGIIKLASKMSEGDISISDMKAVLLPALRGGGNDLDEKDVSKIIQNEGIIGCTTAVANLITSVLSTGGEEDKKKPQEEL